MAETFQFNGKEYNMDITGIPVRPDRERYDWGIKNKWLRQYHGSRNFIISSAMRALDSCGWQVPKYKAAYLPKDMNPWICDSCLDISYLPEFNLCLKAGLDCRKEFDYKIHGMWAVYLDAHMYRAIGAYEKCLEMLKEHDYSKTWLSTIHGHEKDKIPWIEQWIKELGAMSDFCYDF